MKKETFEAQKAFAGEKKPSMLRRCVGHDYTERQIYMITMVTEGRRPLFGQVMGKSDAPIGSDDAPRMVLSELGQCVVDEWWATELHHPEIKIVALQMMPDHLHGILFVREKMEKPLGMALRGFKQSCNKHYREMGIDNGVALAAQHTGRSCVGGATYETGCVGGATYGTSCVGGATYGTGCIGGATYETGCVGGATYETGCVGGGTYETGCVGGATYETGCVGGGTYETGCVGNATYRTGWAGRQTEDGMRRGRRGEDRTHGLLFERGYNDRLLLRAGQLDAWCRYLADNPRRLLMKREHPDLFRVQRNVKAAGLTFSAIGNRFLLSNPVRVQVQCSRSLTEKEIQAKVSSFLALARQGAVLVSPAISPGEKAVMRSAFNEGHPLIFLQENGFTDLAKPGGARMEACAQGRLLILAPWEHHNEKIAIDRGQCLELNEIARRVCGGG